MKNKKNLVMALGLAGAMLVGGQQAVFAADQQPAATTDAQAQAAIEGYTYTSPTYGYTIWCPQKPNVIAADQLYDGAKGEVLIFANQEYTINNAWVILTDAFDTKNTPDYNKMKDADAQKYLDDLQKNNGYESVMFFNQEPNNKAVFAITAKDVEVTGENGETQTMHSDTQEAVTFFRGADGKAYSLQLIDNPDITEEHLLAFKKGVMSFAPTNDKAVQQSKDKATKPAKASKNKKNKK